MEHIFFLSMYVMFDVCCGCFWNFLLCPQFLANQLITLFYLFIYFTKPNFPALHLITEMQAKLSPSYK